MAQPPIAERRGKAAYHCFFLFRESQEPGTKKEREIPLKVKKKGGGSRHEKRRHVGLCMLSCRGKKKKDLPGKSVQRGKGPPRAVRGGGMKNWQRSPLPPASRVRGEEKDFIFVFRRRKKRARIGGTGSASAKQGPAQNKKNGLREGG